MLIVSTQTWEGSVEPLVEEPVEAAVVAPVVDAGLPEAELAPVPWPLVVPGPAPVVTPPEPPAPTTRSLAPVMALHPPATLPSAIHPPHASRAIRRLPTGVRMASMTTRLCAVRSRHNRLLAAAGYAGWPVTMGSPKPPAGPDLPPWKVSW
jgi:hypothetical protein